jgi:hypothetical protein
VTDSVHLINATIGLEPFVLIEVDTDTITDDGLNLKLQYGGGVPDRDGVAILLLTAIEQITGASAEAYVEQVNAARQAEGLPPLLPSGH